MTYQICPKCEGTGTIWTVFAIQNYQIYLKCQGSGTIWTVSVTQSARCPVCEGKMIISTLTEQPPSDKKPEDHDSQKSTCRGVQERIWR